MDSSTDSFEEIEESMMELVQRAEAFLAAFPPGYSSSSSDSSEASSDGNPANDSNLSSISRHDSSVADSSISEVVSYTSTNSATSTGRANRADSSGTSGGIDLSVNSGASTSRGSSAFRSSNMSNSFGDTSASSVSSLQRTFSEDCVLVPESPVPVIDLCSSWVAHPRNVLRQIANSAPVVDSITLDETINEPEQVAAAPVRPQPVAVVNEYQDEPPAKKSKEGAVLNLSQSFDEPAIALICPICFGSIFKKQGSSTICGHLFCHECICQEVKLRKQCPLCKRKLTLRQVHPIYSN